VTSTAQQPRKIQPREADSATSTFSIHSPFFLSHFRNHLLSFARISDTEQLILFQGSLANRIYSGSPSFDQTNPTNTHLLRAE